jgi:DNA mismatch endonuclease (patch repair protein)
MADILSPAQRKQLMSRVARRDTKPEWILRSALHRLGFRYRVDPPGLPGHPDLVLAKYRSVIFVHGCFWHAHDNCRRATLPSTNRVFWQQKLQRNVERDREIAAALEQAGWQVLVVWECELYADPVAVVERLVGQLQSPRAGALDYKERLRRLSRLQLLGVAEDKVRYRLGDRRLAGPQRPGDTESQ